MSSRGIRRARVLLLLLLAAWFFSPPNWRYALPLWLPFVVALVLEVEFAVVGWLHKGPSPPLRGRAPQLADLERFGWAGAPPDEDDPAFWNSPPAPRLAPSWSRRMAASLLVVAFVAVVVWGVSIRRGWSGLAPTTQAQVKRVISQQASQIADHPVRIRCDDAGRHVGAVQEAAQVGGTEAWLTPDICLQLYHLIDQHDTHSFNPTGRAIAVWPMKPGTSTASPTKASRTATPTSPA